MTDEEYLELGIQIGIAEERLWWITKLVEQGKLTEWEARVKLASVTALCDQARAAYDAA